MTDPRNTSPGTCDRSREWASLRLDGELSELEQALLDAHLRALRRVPRPTRPRSLPSRERLRLVEPELLTTPVTLPRRATGALRSLQTGVAAAMVIAAAALGSGLGVLERSHSTSVALFAPHAGLVDRVRRQRRHTARPSPQRADPGGARADAQTSRSPGESV